MCVCVCVCTYDQDVVELLHPVYLGQQLVDHSVVHAGAARHAATLLTDGVDLIEDDDVQPTVGPQLERRGGAQSHIHAERVSMCMCVCKNITKHK